MERPTDVIVKITTSAICGTDLNVYDGETIMEMRQNNKNLTESLRPGEEKNIKS